MIRPLFFVGQIRWKWGGGVKFLFKLKKFCLIAVGKIPKYYGIRLLGEKTGVFPHVKFLCKRERKAYSQEGINLFWMIGPLLSEKR